MAESPAAGRPPRPRAAIDGGMGALGARLPHPHLAFPTQPSGARPGVTPVRGPEEARVTAMQEEGERRRRYVTRSEIVTDMRDLGVRPGRILMVHTRMSALGWVVGGTQTVVESLLEAVGPD